MPLQSPNAFDPGRALPDLSGGTLDVARRLLGSLVIRREGSCLVAGRIIETEAYLPDDPASHSFRGPTARNASMFGRPGLAYVYLIYGVHHCLNVVTEPAGVGAAVLIRALEPVTGLEIMQAWCGRKTGVANGPGKLCQALRIDLSLDGEDLVTSDRLFLRAGEPFSAAEVRATGRIGLTKATELPWRFVVAAHAARSRA